MSTSDQYSQCKKPDEFDKLDLEGEHEIQTTPLKKESQENHLVIKSEIKIENGAIEENEVFRYLE